MESQALPQPAAGAAYEAYWGDITSSLEWCEHNYTWSPYIAEWWNSVSMVVQIACGAYSTYSAIRQGFETRFVILCAVVLLIGLGSFAFHATLKHDSQQLDETPMEWVVLTWLYCLVWHRIRPQYRYTVAVAFTAFGLGFAVVHYLCRFTTFFQVQFAVAVLIALVAFHSFVGHYKEGVPALPTLYWSYVTVMLLGTAVWLVDLHLCHHMHHWLPFNPQGHAIWHVCVGIATYLAPVSVMSARAHELGWLWHCIPVLYRGDRKLL